MEMDATGIGLGAVLAQKQEDGSVRLLAYASRSLQKHERNYGVTELEALAVVWGVKHSRPYLYGHRCDVYTDHQALKSLLNTPQLVGGWLFKSWICTFTVDQEARTRMQMPCHVTLLLLCFRVQLSLIPAN